MNALSLSLSNIQSESLTHSESNSSNHDLYLVTAPASLRLRSRLGIELSNVISHRSDCCEPAPCLGVVGLRSDLVLFAQLTRDLLI